MRGNVCVSLEKHRKAFIKKKIYFPYFYLTERKHPKGVWKFNCCLINIRN